MKQNRRIIYKTSYKTFVLMKTILMVLLAIAMLGQLCFGTGMMAVVVAGICQYIMLDHIFYLFGKASENEI